MRQATNKPIRKVQAGWVTSGISVATIAAIIKWVWPVLFPTYPLGAVEATVIAGLVVAIISGAASYLTPPSPLDVPIDKTQAKAKAKGK